MEKTPDSIAVEYEGQALTYRELNRKANQLAHHLRMLGVGAETVVAQCVQPSPEMLVGLVGILKAGGSYLPLEPNYPRERVAFMLSVLRGWLLERWNAAQAENAARAHSNATVGEALLSKTGHDAEA